MPINDLKYSRGRYDKARISHEAAENKVKLLKRAGQQNTPQGQQKIAKVPFLAQIFFTATGRGR